MQTTAEEFTQQNDLHKNNTLFDTGFRGLLSAFEKQKIVFSRQLGRKKNQTLSITVYIFYTHGDVQYIII